jgi:hypothetical protein
MLGSGRARKVDNSFQRLDVLVEGIRDKQTVGINGSSKPLYAHSPIMGIKGASCGPLGINNLVDSCVVIANHQRPIP